MSCGFDPSDIDDVWWKEVQEGDVENINVPCERDVWEHDGHSYDRCIWHVRTESKDSNEIAVALSNEDTSIDFPYLVESDLGDADFSGKVCRYGNFSGADFRDATMTHASFNGSKFNGANLSGLELNNVDFPHAELDAAIMNRITCLHTDFSNTSLNEAVLVQSQLQTGVDFSGATLDRAVFTGTVAEEGTLSEFESTYENTDWEKASREYERLMQVAETSSLGDLRDYFYIKQKQAKRQSYDFASRKRFFAGCSRLVFLYGERPSWAVGWSLAFIIGFIPVIACVGGIASQGETVPLTVTNASEYAYFSGVTFSTVGSGDYAPATPLARLVEAGEALLGGVMIALVVFSLGRRATK